MYGYIVSNAIIFNAYLIHHLVNIYIYRYSVYVILHHSHLLYNFVWNFFLLYTEMNILAYGIFPLWSFPENSFPGVRLLEQV